MGHGAWRKPQKSNKEGRQVIGFDEKYQGMSLMLSAFIPERFSRIHKYFNPQPG
jgi:hypothetical protein